MSKKFFSNITSLLLQNYLKFVYFTTKWNYILPSYYSLDDFNKSTNTIFALWHNRLALAPYLFRKHRNTHALVSPHKDGKIIGDILKSLGHKIIEGSTNRNPFSAIRSIISVLNNGSNVVITPDGPRGPKYKINSNMVGIAKRAKADIIPLSFNITNKVILSSWDSFIFPLPFSRGTVIIGEKIELCENEELAMLKLEQELVRLSDTEVQK